MSSAKRIFFGVIIGSLLLMCIVLAVANAQLRADTTQLQVAVKSLLVNLSYTTTRIEVLETEISDHKTYTNAEFESTWRSLARVNNNFKALGTGYHLEEKDIAPPDAYASRKLGIQGVLQRKYEERRQ